MMADPRVDIGQASHLTGDTSRLGGVSPHAIWIDRLIRQQGKPLVSATGNYGAALLAIGEFPAAPEAFAIGAYTPAARSDEHTSELQSLMRISYAVFCFKN